MAELSVVPEQASRVVLAAPALLPVQQSLEVRLGL
jgi:hypothetical protein